MLIFVDLETTGLNPRECKVLEIAAVCRDRTGKRYHFRSLVNPGIDLTSEDLDPGIRRALEINHIDPATLTGAPSTEEVAGRFRLWLTERALDGPVKLAGFNSSRYDAVILSRPPWEIPINMWKYDVMDMAMEWRWRSWTGRGSSPSIRITGSPSGRSCPRRQVISGSISTEMPIRRWPMWVSR